MTVELLGPALIALTSAALYGLGLVLTQLGLRARSPLGVACVSLPTTATVLWLTAPLFLDVQAIDWKAVAIFAGVGLVFPVGVSLLSFETNRRMGPNLAGAIGNITPLFALSFAVLLLGEHLTPLRGMGAAIVICGVVLLSWRGAAGGPQWPLWTLLLPLAAAVIRGLAQSLIKLGLLQWNDPYVATLANYTVSALVILAIAAVGSASGPSKAAPSPSVWRERGTFVLIAFANGTSILLMYAALSRSSVALVAPLNATYPLFTLAFSALLLRGEPMGPRLFAGVATTVAGVTLVLIG